MYLAHTVVHTHFGNTCLEVRLATKYQLFGDQILEIYIGH